MFNNLQHQLMCEIEGIENSAGSAAAFCENEEWEYIPECMNVIFKRFRSAFKLCIALGLINPPSKNDSAEPSQVEVVSSEPIKNEDSNA